MAEVSLDFTRFDSDEERMINAMMIHAKSQHLNLCSQCPLQDSEEEDEDGNYEGECTFLIANAALAIIEKQQKQIEDLEERIAIMSESDDTGEELPFLYDDTPDEPSEEDERM